MVLAIVLPAFLSIAADIGQKNPDATLQSHFSALGADARLALYRSGFSLSVLADRAYAMTDAIVRTLYRLVYSRKNLLEWTTSAQAKSMAVATAGAYYKRMAGAVAVAIASGAMLGMGAGGGAVVALPFVAVWLASPMIAHWVSFARTTKRQVEISAASRASLRLTGWRTWQYFETFVTESENYLPPDNYQEDPRPVVAHRTSPTNIGLYLLSLVSAEKFGWISTGEAAGRIEKTLRTLGRLERYNGHFYNWYNTETLETLPPRYVSTVDSGNLAGHLLALSSACRDWAAPSYDAKSAADGLRDCIAVILANTSAAEADVMRHVGRIENRAMQHGQRTQRWLEL